MTSEFICKRCEKQFLKINNYNSHVNRKTPCKSIVKTDDLSLNFSQDKEYSSISYSLTKMISKDIKKKNGIYFTPPKTIHENLNLLEPYMNKIHKILEPSCGSCEYIKAMNERYSNKTIIGVEYNDIIFNSIKHFNTMSSLNTINIIHQDFISYEMETEEIHNDENLKFDLIIGNPPYFVMNKKEVDKRYCDYFDGRPNIYVLFIIKSISLLKTGGILSFVLPKNFLNCLYYDKTRKYIDEHFKILNIIECNDKYIETEQETILMIIQKVDIDKSTNEESNNDLFILNINNYTIFGTPHDILQLKELRNHSTSLSQLGFKVSVGTVVWNQVKELLTDDDTKTRLIYSSDIKNNTLSFKKYSNNEKKNFINKNGFHGLTNPVLVINRGYGMGDYTFEYCLIHDDFDYLIENHLICIHYNVETESDNNDNDVSKLLDLYKKIMNSLEDERTKKFIGLYFGNNAINTVELNHILPIY